MSKDAGLTLAVAAGTALCKGSPTNYLAGRLAMVVNGTSGNGDWHFTGQDLSLAASGQSMPSYAQVFGAGRNQPYVQLQSSDGSNARPNTRCFCLSDWMMRCGRHPRPGWRTSAGADKLGTSSAGKTMIRIGRYWTDWYAISGRKPCRRDKPGSANMLEVKLN